jgi:hypothetical protein
VILERTGVIVPSDCFCLNPQITQRADERAIVVGEVRLSTIGDESNGLRHA